jgi:hypothetical protein
MVPAQGIVFHQIGKYRQLGLDYITVVISSEKSRDAAASFPFAGET